MPVEIGVWRIDEEPTRLSASRLNEESRLETLLESDDSVLGQNVLILGRQVVTASGGRIDLLGIDAEGHLLAIELKRNKTPRDVVAQALDYGSWVVGLGYDAISEIFTTYSQRSSLEEAFVEKFGITLPDPLNEQHQLVIVASELDASTERIISYLSTEHRVPINAIFFRYFADEGREYLARTWLIEPAEIEGRIGRQPGSGRAPWNGQDFYVNYGEYEHRSWEDARKFSFLSAGQGRRYSGPLHRLQPGHRVFVCIPGSGYVAVGTVTEPAKRIRDFEVEFDGRRTPILQVPLEGEMSLNAEDEEKSEYLVRVTWDRPTLSREQAYWETGMFANQNIVCALRDRFTLEKLVGRFGLEE